MRKRRRTTKPKNKMKNCPFKLGSKESSRNRTHLVSFRHITVSLFRAYNFLAISYSLCDYTKLCLLLLMDWSSTLVRINNFVALLYVCGYKSSHSNKGNITHSFLIDKAIYHIFLVIFLADKIGFGYVIYLIFCRRCNTKSIHIYNPFINFFTPLPIDNMFYLMYYCLLRGRNRQDKKFKIHCVRNQSTIAHCNFKPNRLKEIFNTRFLRKVVSDQSFPLLCSFTIFGSQLI